MVSARGTRTTLRGHCCVQSACHGHATRTSWRRTYLQTGDGICTATLDISYAALPVKKLGYSKTRTRQDRWVQMLSYSKKTPGQTVQGQHMYHAQHQKLNVGSIARGARDWGGRKKNMVIHARWYGMWCMVYGTWYMVSGMVDGTWYVVYGMVYGIWYGIWYMVR